VGVKKGQPSGLLSSPCWLTAERVDARGRDLKSVAGPAAEYISLSSPGMSKVLKGWGTMKSNVKELKRIRASKQTRGNHPKNETAEVASRVEKHTCRPDQPRE